MRSTIDAGSGLLVRVVAVFAVAVAANAACAQTVRGTATYKERIALPQDAVFEAAIEDVSRADAPAEVIATTRRGDPGNPPIAFTIPYDRDRIVADHRYVVRARILVGDQLMFASDTAAPVITGGNPTTVSMMLRRVGAQNPEAGAAQAPPLEGTYWKAIELDGKPVPAQEPQREAHLVFQPGGRVSGSDGCNRITGSYEQKGESLTFGQLAATQMACPGTEAIERPFHDALKRAARFRIDRDRLELSDDEGTSLATFAGAAPEAQSRSPLAGTSWRLVKFQGSDDTTLVPDDGLKYTIEFGATGQLTARIDCNRGRSTWTSPEPSLVQFGPLTITRAACPPGSLHDQIVRQWPHVRSYVIRDGHLFLALMADGGIYEFAPLASK